MNKGHSPLGANFTTRGQSSLMGATSPLLANLTHGGKSSPLWAKLKTGLQRGKWLRHYTLLSEWNVPRYVNFVVCKSFCCM
jgi:hypothetical protein